MVSSKKAQIIIRLGIYIYTNSINCTVLTLNQIATFNRCTEVLSCKAVQKCSAVCLLHKEINNEQKGKQLERSSGLAGGQSTTEV